MRPGANKARLVLQEAWDKGCINTQHQHPAAAKSKSQHGDYGMQRHGVFQENLTVLQTEVLAKTVKTHVGFKSIHETNVDNATEISL